MPHPLAGVWEKIRRADEHIDNLNNEIDTFLKSNVYNIKHQPGSDASEHVLHILGPEPPLRFSVIAGEVIHQCRSSLDHLVWQLVIANKREPNHKHEFPICETSNKFKSACERGKLKGISNSAACLIESLQPYHNPKGYEWHPLWNLHAMDITDKHRLLMVVVAYAMVHTVNFGGCGEGPIELTNLMQMECPAKATSDGTEIMRLKFAKPEPDLDIQADAVIHIAFEKYGGAQKQPVIHCLRDLREKTVRTILKFVPELKRV